MKIPAVGSLPFVTYDNVNSFAPELFAKVLDAADVVCG